MISSLAPGLLLISDPFLKDPNFLRTVVFLCEHQTEGSFGFVLNRQYDHTLGELISDLEDNDFPVYFGGPVQADTIHFLHRRPDLIHDGLLVKDHIYWGGNFTEVVTLLQNKQLQPTEIRFFIGYSGWGEGQLANEVKDKSWITAAAKSSLVFSKKADQVWKEALRNMGGEYEFMVNYPIDPHLN